MRSRGEHGGVAIFIAVLIPAIVAIGAGLIVLGRVTSQRQRLQYAADAVAANGALLAKRQGLASFAQANTQSNGYPWLPSAAMTQAMLDTSRDGNLPIGGTQPSPSFRFETRPDGDWVDSAIAMQRPFLGFNVQAAAEYRMHQVKTGSPRRRPPGVILVLDYSNSMNKQGDGGSAIQLLRNAVAQFTAGLTPDFVNLGLVIYGSNVYTTVQPEISSASSNFANINAATATGASGDTDTADAIRTATQMLTSLPENFGRNIILISDGEPCCGGNATADAIAAADAAKGAALTQVYTIFVDHAGVTGNPTATLQAIASPGAAFTVSPQTITNLLATFDVQPLCDLVPPSDPNDSWAFVRDERSGGSERSLLRYADTPDMSCPDHCDTYGFVSQTNPFPRVIFSSRACTDIFDGNHSAIMRWGQPVLNR